jgi:hypothetical protein
MASLDDVYRNTSSSEQKPIQNAMQHHNSNTPHFPHTLINGEESGREMPPVGSHEEIQQAIAKQNKLSQMQQMQQMGVSHQTHQFPSSDLNGPAHNGQAHHGPAHNGQAHHGQAHHGPAHHGPAHHGPLNPMNGQPYESFHRPMNGKAHGHSHRPTNGAPYGYPHKPPHVGPPGSPSPQRAQNGPHSILKTAGETRLPQSPNRVHFPDEMPKYTYDSSNKNEAQTSQSRSKNKDMSRLVQKTGSKVPKLFLEKNGKMNKKNILLLLSLLLLFIFGILIATCLSKNRNKGNNLNNEGLKSVSMPQLQSSGLRSIRGGGIEKDVPRMSMSNFFTPSRF